MRTLTLQLLQGLMKKNGHVAKIDFGTRLASLRKARGLTQAEMGRRLGVSPRMMVYYESSQSNYVPVRLLPTIAHVLRCTADELVGTKSVKTESPKESMRLLNKFRIISQLPAKERKAVIDYAQALLSKKSPSK